MNRKELEEAGLIYQQNERRKRLLILKSKVFTTQEERKRLQQDLQHMADQPVLLLPAYVDVAEERGYWIDKKDTDYAGGSYSECSNCGMKYSHGAYFEPWMFRHCPTCGRKMEVDEDE